MHSIEHIVRDHLKLSKKVREDVLAVYGLIAEAESAAHGVPVTEIHFHEVGTMDAVADVSAVCYLLEQLAPDEIIASPIHVGSGKVKCAHGILPVPAPATAHILKDCPIYGGKIQGELCTPTGAALLKHFVTGFTQMPPMSVKAVGYGMGKKDFEAANCVRVMLGESFDSQDGSRIENTSRSSGSIDKNVQANGDDILELSCNMDDMTGEAVGFAMERLFEAGARDVFTVPIGMKKNRPGILLNVICSQKDKDKIVKTIFKYTTTIGIRECRMNRYILDRRIETEDTPYGSVRCKISEGYGVERRKYEYEDLAGIAARNGLSIEQVKNVIDEISR